ncbi:tRNA-specific adenosine deaminase, partial [Leucobacter sp. OLJS4]
MQLNDDDRRFLDLAIEQARIGWAEGGVPIGAALVHFGADGPEV